ncbi:MAG: hypothetical protein IH591_15730 [Bacteroidales bacterium]|nr:hypothetical protein [Bacteroidales bacterium]
MRILILISRIIGGLVFMFSGFVKGVDPAGFQIKLSDYALAAGFELPASLLLLAAMILCAAEFIIGVLILTGSFYRTGVWLFFLFMAFFTPLTLILALYNPVSDCGCFGDAIHLTNWQTFIKNIIIIIPAVILVSTRKSHLPKRDILHDAIPVIITLLLFTAFMSFNIRNLPIIDFRPYKIGINIPESMSIPDDAPNAVYDITLIYEKEGIQKEFTIDNYPAGDSSWKFIDQKSVLVTEGFQPPIKDFHISSTDGRDMTDQIIYDKGYTLLMISHNLEKAREKDLENGFITGFNAVNEGISFYVVTSSAGDVIEKFQNGLQFTIADGTLLKTIIRSNPGYMLISDGTIVGKWSPHRLPEHEWFNSLMVSDIIRAGANLRSLLLTALFIIIMTIAFLTAKRYYCKSDNEKHS